MRQSPDRIIIGEIRNGAALDLLKSWNTGHPGGVTTLHANSCLEALSRLEMLILEAVPNPMQGLIGQAVGLVLFIQRLKTGPTLTEIMEVVEYDRRNEEYVVNWIKKPQV
jgi:type IV secretion system protein VirB11